MGSLARLGKLLLRGPAGAGRWYSETARAFPATTGIVTTVLKTSTADLLAQKVLERKEEVDWRRNGVFCAFGFAYLGCWQFYLYNRVFASWTPHLTRLVGRTGNAVTLTFIDQCIHHPLMYFPVFYLFKGAMEGRPVPSSLTNCREHLWDNCQALWMIWVPSQLVNFAFVPAHMRIPFVAAVSFGWTVILSGLRGSLDGPGVAVLGEAAAEAAAAVLLGEQQEQQQQATAVCSVSVAGVAPAAV